MGVAEFRGNLLGSQTRESYYLGDSIRVKGVVQCEEFLVRYDMPREPDAPIYGIYFKMP